MKTLRNGHWHIKLKYSNVSLLYNSHRKGIKLDYFDFQINLWKTQNNKHSAPIFLWIEFRTSFLHWFPNAIYSKRFPNSFCVHFFDIHVDSEKYTFILYSFKKITNDGSKIHVRFRDIYLLSISPKMGKMLLPFLEGAF